MKKLLSKKVTTIILILLFMKCNLCNYNNETALTTTIKHQTNTTSFNGLATPTKPTKTTSSPTAIDSRSCNKKTTNFNLTVFVFMILMIPFTSLGNIIVFVVIISSKQLRHQTTYKFLLSLAVADMLLGLFITPLRAKKSWNNNLFCVPSFFCWLFNLTENLLSMTSVLHLVIIGIDRFLSLRYVYQYEVYMTRKKVLLIISSIWILTITMTCMSVFKWNDPSTIAIVHLPNKLCTIDNTVFYTFIVILLFYIPLPFIVYMYYFVYTTATRHISDIVKMEVGSGRTKELKKKRKQLHLFRSIITLFIVFVICWIPSTIFHLCTIYFRSTLYKIRFEKWFRATYFMLVFILPPLNSAINPLIYVISNQQFRRAFGRLIKRTPLKNFIGHSNSSLLTKNVSMHLSNTAEHDNTPSQVTTNVYMLSPLKEVPEKRRESNKPLNHRVKCYNTIISNDVATTYSL